MAKSANIHVRIDPDTKLRTEELFSSFGITVSDAIIMFLRKSLMVGGLPFEVVHPRYNAETESAIIETKKILTGQLSTKTFASLDAFYADLEANNDEI
ncbi:MAG: type II toxin-antitoxin system RelB/DinJ family antitoxin [Defluviitaleaceae bacterium]|nr:type II toxin-antitoxin system RelB/DinJ family antitoxin [Defluviitaleaceae bacterium]